MRGDVSRDWESVPLGRVAKRIRRPLSGDPEHILMITSTGGFVPQSEKYSRFMAGESLKKYVELHRGEFAYNKGNSKTYPQGCVFRLDGWEKAAVPNIYFSFAVNEKQVAPEYAAQYFVAGGLNSQLKNVITSGARGNGLLNVSPEDFFSCHLPLPPLAEQRKIAAILTSVDEAIRATEAVIAQTRRVKEGLLQELLTKGIGRGDSKQSEYGLVPASWPTQKVSDIASVEYGISESVSQNNDCSIGWPILTGRNITLDGTLDIERVVYIKVPTKERFILQKDDLLLNWRSGSPAHVGKTARFDLDGNWTYASFVLRVRAKEGKLDPAFGHLLFNYMRANDLFSRDTSIQVNFKMNATVFRDVVVYIPEIQEQREIASQVGGFDMALDQLTRELTALKATKSGLLQDLLTGRVRVTP